MERVDNVLETTLKNLKNMIDMSIVMGDERKIGEWTLVPISKISLGFVSGGGEYGNSKKLKHEPSFPFAGGGGGGCNITPIGFLAISSSKQKFIKVDNTSDIEKIIDVISSFTSSNSKGVN